MEQQTQKAPKVTGDMTISDIIKKYPSVIEPLQAAGIHCVGCGVAQYESLDQGLRAHGLDNHQVVQVMEAVNKAAELSSAEEGEGQDLIITQKAADKLKQVLKDNGKEGEALRVSVVPGGCSGFEYGLELGEKQKEDDIEFKDKGVTIIIPKENFSMLKGSKVDYVDSLQGAGFKITNPNATNSCACGQSFV